MGFVHTSPGFPHNTPGFRVKIDGLNTLRLNGTPVPFPSSGITRVGCAIGGIGAGHSEAFLNPLYPLHYNWNTPKTKGTANEISNYPFVSNEFTLPGALGETIEAVGSDVALNVEIRTGEGASSRHSIQAFSLRFPGNQTWPRPRLKATAARNFDQRVAAANSMAPGYSVSPLLKLKMDEAWAISGRDFRRSLIDSEDVVRSVQVSPQVRRRATIGSLPAGRMFRRITSNHIRTMAVPIGATAGRIACGKIDGESSDRWAITGGRILRLQSWGPG